MSKKFTFLLAVVIMASFGFYLIAYSEKIVAEISNYAANITLWASMTYML